MKAHLELLRLHIAECERLRTAANSQTKRDLYTSLLMRYRAIAAHPLGGVLRFNDSEVRTGFLSESDAHGFSVLTANRFPVPAAKFPCSDLGEERRGAREFLRIFSLVPTLLGVGGLCDGVVFPVNFPVHGK